jgi:hypothetical protein
MLCTTKTEHTQAIWTKHKKSTNLPHRIFQTIEIKVKQLTVIISSIKLKLMHIWKLMAGQSECHIISCHTLTVSFLSIRLIHGQTTSETNLYKLGVLFHRCRSVTVYKFDEKTVKMGKKTSLHHEMSMFCQCEILFSRKHIKRARYVLIIW